MKSFLIVWRHVDRNSIFPANCDNFRRISSNHRVALYFDFNWEEWRLFDIHNLPFDGIFTELFPQEDVLFEGRDTLLHSGDFIMFLWHGHLFPHFDASLGIPFEYLLGPLAENFFSVVAVDVSFLKVLFNRP